MYRIIILVGTLIFSSPLHSKSVEDYERLYRYLPCAGLQSKVFDINAKYNGGTDRQKKSFGKHIERSEIYGKRKFFLVVFKFLTL